MRLPAQDAETLRRDFPALMRRRAHDIAYLGNDPNQILKLHLVRLRDVHFHDNRTSGSSNAADRRVVDSLGLIGVLALVLASINYVNLATARALLRAREVAMRKVLGAARHVLIGQFLTEALVLTACAALVGLALTEGAVPLVNALGGWHVTLAYGWLLPVLTGVVLVVGIGAGLYPAFVLSGFRPGPTLASSRAPSGGRLGMRVRAILVGAQFAFAVGFAICALVIYAEGAYLRHADRGFQRADLMQVTSLQNKGLMKRQKALVDAMRDVPGVRSITTSDFAPGGCCMNNTNSVWRDGMVGRRPSLAFRRIGTDYFETYGIHALAGRTFDLAHGEDDFTVGNGPDHTHNVVLDETAVHTLGFASPAAAIGQTVHIDPGPLTVIGVVENVRFESGHSSNSPQIYLLSHANPIEDAQAAIRYDGNLTVPTMKTALEHAWKAVAPDVPFEARPVEDILAQFYRPDEQRGELFGVGALISIVIACLGLYGLAAFNVTRRMHEIGIRKTLGASSRQVMTMVLVEFLKPVAIASLVACPAAWLLMRGWLSGFDQRIALSPIYFFTVIAAALGLCVLTVVGQTFRLAHAEPARALRFR